MRPAAAPGIKATKIDFRESLLETPAINERAKQLPLSRIEGSAWRAPCCGNGRSNADVAIHIHRVPPMWLSAADQTTSLPTKRAEVQADLKISSAAILGLLTRALEAAEVPHSKTHGVAFTDNVIADDSRHHREIAIFARQRRECGFGK
jgi:hypothetical protein